MTTPQDPPKRNKQKRRRTKKLAEWRAKQENKTASAPATAKTATAKKAAAKKAKA